MKTLLVLALALLPTVAAAQVPADYEATPHGRVLACYGQAYTIVELVDVATKHLSMVAAESVKEATPARQQMLVGMLASGTLNDQQQALDVVERLEQCVQTAVDRAVPDAAARYAAGALIEEVAIGMMMADGFVADYRLSAAALDRFLVTADDAALRSSTNSVFSKFGASVKATLERVRLAGDRLVEKSTPRP
jgi:hypothetical protein